MDVGDMMQVWKELLLVDEVQPTSDFFELGGHSMLAIRLVRRLRKQFGVKIAPAAVMDYPTPEELTRVARQAPRVSP